MDIGGLSNSLVQSLVANNPGNGDQVAVKVLNTAKDIQKQTATQLLDALPDPASNLGRNLNTYA